MDLKTPKPPLKKPVFALAVVPTTGKITVLSRKIWSVLLYIAQNQGHDLKVHRAPLTQIVTGLDYGSNNTGLLKAHLRALAGTVVEWDSPTTGEGTKWTVCTLLQYATISKEKSGIYLEWAYSDPMRDQLLDPMVFAKIELEMMMQLSSHPAVTLYGICSRYRDIPKTARNPVDWWRPVLTGKSDVAAKKVMEYRHLKRDVLRPAIAEINAVTDLEIELIEHKIGRFVTDIQFGVKKNAKSKVSTSMAMPKPINLKQVADALELGIDPGKAEKLVLIHGEVAMDEALASLKKRLANPFPEPIRDPVRYLMTLLVGTKPSAVIDDSDTVEEPRDPVVAATAVREKVKEWRVKWRQQVSDQVVEELNSFSSERQAELSEGLLDHLVATNAHPSLISTLKAKGWTHRIVRSLMVDYYASAARGPAWSEPTQEQLLNLAATSTLMPDAQMPPL